MQDYDRTLELTQIAQNSAGRADEQFAKYSDTIEYQVNKLKNTWEEFRTSILDSSVLKGALAVAKELLSVVNGFFSGNIITTIPLIISLFTAIKGTKGVLGNIQDKITKKVNEYKEAVGKETEEQKEKQKEKNNFKEYGETAGAEIGKAMEASGKKVADEIREAMGFSDDDTAEDVVDEAGNNIQNDTTDAAKNLADTMTDATKENIEEESKAKDNEREKNIAATQTSSDVQIETANNAAQVTQDSTAKATDTLVNGAELGAQSQIQGGKAAGEELVNGAAEAAQINKQGEKNNPSPENTNQQQPDWIQKNAKKIQKVLGVIQTTAMAFSTAKIVTSAVHEIYKNRQDAEEENFQRIAKQMSENLNMSSAVAAEKQTATLEQAVNSIEKLQDRSFVTEKEEEKLTEAIELMNSEYPELVKSYDKNTGKIELFTDKIDEEIETQKEVNNVQAQAQLGRITNRRANATGQVIDDLQNHSFNNGILTSSSQAEQFEIGASIYAGAAGLAAGAAAGTAAGTAILPVIGTAIGAIVGLIAGVAAEEIADVQYNNDEYINRISALDTETRSKVFEGINEKLGTSITSTAELRNYLDANKDELANVAGITQQILQEVQKQQRTEDITKAENENLARKINFGTTENPLYLTEEQWATARNSKETKSQLAQTGGLGQFLETEELRKGEKSFADSSDFKAYASAIDKNMYLELVNIRERFKQEQNHLAQTWADLSADQRKTYAVIGEENWSALMSAASGEYGDWFDNGANQAVDIILNNLAISLLSGLEIDQSQEKYVKLFEKLSDSERNAVYNFIDKYTDFSQEASEYTYEELQKQMQDEATSLKNRDWGNSQTAKAISELIDNYLSSESNAAKQSLDTNLKKSRDYLLQVFDEAFINNLSIEGTNLWAEYAQTIANSPQKNFIFKTFNDTLNSLPDSIKLNTSKFRQVSDFIISTLVPEKMDAGTLSNLTNQLEKLTGDAKLANEVVYGLWDIWKNNGIKTATMDMSKFNEVVEESTTKTKDLISALGTLKSTFEKSITKEGLGGSDILSLLDAGLTDAIGESGEYSFIKAIDAMSAQSESAIRDAQENIKAAIARGEDPETSQDIQKERINLLALEAESRQKANEILKMGETLEKNATDATEKYTAALKSERDAVKKLEDAQKAQYEAYYGSEFYVPSLDPWFNFDSILKRINNDLDEQSSELKTIKTLSEAIDVVDRQNAVMREKAIINTAEQVEMEKMIYHYIQQANDLLSGVAAFENGAINVNWGLLNNTRMPDAQKEEAIRAIQDAEKLTETWRSKNKENARIEQDFNNQLKENLQKRVAFQEKGAEILKAAADKEVKTQKNKYDALKKADDDYLNALSNAIEKQRRLRDQENALDDLAQKEKQLALMRRDTSGSQQKQIQSLEKDVEKSRQDVLDKTVDDIIQTLKDEAEKRDEERQAIIEATEAVNEATNFVKEFNEISRNWTTEQEALNWFNSISPNLTELTPEQIEAQQNEFTQTWNEQLPYLAQQQLQVTQFAQATTNEITNTLNTVSNNAQFASDTATAKVLDNIETEQKAKDDAVLDAEEVLKKVRDEIEETKKAQDDAVLTYNNYLNAMNAGGETAIKNYLTTVSDSVLSMGELTIQAMGNIAIEAMAAATEALRNSNNTATSRRENYQTRYDNAENDYVRQGLIKAAQQDGYYFNNGTFYYSKSGKAADEISLAQNPVSGVSMASRVATLKDVVTNNDDETYNISKRIESAKLDQLWNELEYYDGDGKYKQWHSSTHWVSTKDDPRDLYPSMAVEKGRNFKITNNETGTAIAVLADEETIKKFQGTDKYTVEKAESTGNFFNPYEWKKYATGGLVNYTGPAWVDGSANRPEAFLSSEDTRRIGEAAKLFALSPVLNSNQPEKVVSSSIGDTTVEININIENISDDYDIDQLVNRVHQDILDAARPTGASVILNKR